MKNVMTIGIRNTQLSENFNACLKTCLKIDMVIIQFFKHFDRVVNDKYIMSCNVNLSIGKI